MQFFSSLGLSLAFLAVSVLGDLHPDCACNNDGTSNSRITIDACTVYNDAKYEWGGSSFDDASGRCVAAEGAELAGKEWEAACKQISSKGFACPDSEGTCYAKTDDVRGSCA
ncbi:hypothetical protein F5X99DRAFT_406378 [Biscogniauxia marginata]|nr:hypothetical protein F5X99DRAFT_406378 [Biscogniauxia marginata]